MIMTPLAITALVLFITYGFLLIFISYRSSKASAIKTGKQFFLGDGVSPFVLMFSTLAALCSTWVVMGCTTTTYTTGWQWIALVVLYQQSFSLAVGYFGPRIWKLRQTYDYASHGDLVAHYYDSKALRYLIAFSYFMLCVFHTLGQLSAVGLAVGTATGINSKIIILIVATFVIVYSSLGGYRGTALIDTVQGMIFTFIIFGGFVLVMFKLGGPANLFAEVGAVDPKLIIYNGNMEGTRWPLMTALSFCFIGAVGGITTPSFWLRYYTASKPQDIIDRMSVKTGLLASIVVPLTSGLVGLSAYAFIARGEATIESAGTVFQSLMSQIGGSYWVLLLLLACIAAGMSTIASNMNMSALTVTYDLVHVFKKDIPETQLKNIGRIVMIGLVLIGAACAMFATGALTTIVQIAVGFGAAPLFPVIGIFIWKRATREGAIAGMVGSLLAQVFSIVVIPNPLGIVSGAWGVIIGAICFVVVSLITVPYSQKHRDDYFTPLKKGRVHDFTNVE